MKMPANTKRVGIMIIGVTGGKGGTGKTFFAVNLAFALLKLGNKVTYFDCDADCPSAHFVLGTKLKNKTPVECFVPKFDEEKCIKCGKCVTACQYNALYQLKDSLPVLLPNICNGCKACQLTCPSGAVKNSKKVIGWTYETNTRNIKLFSGELKPSEPLSEKIVNAIKNRGKEESVDYVIVDTAAGAHCPVVAALRGCERAFVITEPTLFGEHDFQVISSLLKSLRISFETVMNRSTISKKKRSIGIQIPYDKAVVESYVEGMPLVEKEPKHKLSKIFFEVAKRLRK